MNKTFFTYAERRKRNAYAVSWGTMDGRFNLLQADSFASILNYLQTSYRLSKIIIVETSALKSAEDFILARICGSE